MERKSNREQHIQFLILFNNNIEVTFKSIRYFINNNGVVQNTNDNRAYFFFCNYYENYMVFFDNVPFAAVFHFQNYMRLVIDAICATVIGNIRPKLSLRPHLLSLTVVVPGQLVYFSLYKK